MRRLHRIAIALATAVVLAAPSPRATAASKRATAPANPYPGYVSEIYSDSSKWLCRPDKDDVCDHDLDATVVKANGKTKLERWHAARHPKFDCFYIYPTISQDPTGNSDFTPGANEELYVVRQQAARLGSECRVFAPVYRSVTLTALGASLTHHPIPIEAGRNYADVLDAWKQYIANDNQGRGVLLIGHSQGAGLAVNLIKNEIDGNADLRARLVSAVLLGTSLQVPDGADKGGDFQNIPLCHSKRDTGCAITYGSFRSTSPPPASSFFGRSLVAGDKAGCTNPAALGGGSGTLHPYFPTSGSSLGIINVAPPAWVDPSKHVEIKTPFVTLPGLVTAECAETNGFVYLSLTVHGNPADPRIDDIGGDLSPEWGMHLIDANVAMGDLVSLARSQGRAYQKRRR